MQAECRTSHVWSCLVNTQSCKQKAKLHMCGLAKLHMCGPAKLHKCGLAKLHMCGLALSTHTWKLLIIQCKQKAKLHMCGLALSTHNHASRRPNFICVVLPCQHPLGNYSLSNAIPDDLICQLLGSKVSSTVTIDNIVANFSKI